MAIKVKNAVAVKPATKLDRLAEFHPDFVDAVRAAANDKSMTEQEHTILKAILGNVQFGTVNENGKEKAICWCDSRRVGSSLGLAPYPKRQGETAEEKKTWAAKNPIARQHDAVYATVARFGVRVVGTKVKFSPAVQGVDIDEIDSIFDLE